jgi:hypothetical protein
MLEALTIDNLTSWKNRDAKAMVEIEEKTRVLEAAGIKLDMAYIQKLARDEAEANQNIVKIESWKKKLKELQEQRAILLEARWAARHRIAMLRTGYAITASATLKSALTDLQVSLKFASDAYSPDAEGQITQAMGWRTVQVPRAKIIVQQLTVPKLLQAMERNDVSALVGLSDQGVTLFDTHEAAQILEKLRVPPVRFALERIAIDDLPRLSVTRMVGQPPRALTRDFAQLSLGQQQSILLALVLSSKSNNPLIIDQPDHNSDA